MMNRAISHSALCASTALLMVTAASAQQVRPATPSAAPAASAADGIGDIIVTAQRRASSAQRTPLALSAIGGDELAARQITDVERLAASLPNVNLGKNVGFARIAIRGLGLDTTATGQEGRVAYHLDGVYLSRPTAALGTFFDINRVEVVRGPQGTLYGRNATAGAINVITNDPTDTVQGYGRFTVGNYGAFTEEGAIGGPISDRLSARIAVQKVDRSGYGNDLVTHTEEDNEHTGSARAKLRWKPAPNFDLVLSADYRRERDHDYVYHYIAAGKPGVVPVGQRLGGVLPDNPRDSNEESPTENRRTFYGFGAVANWDLGFAKLTSVSGFRHSNTFYNSDVDSTQVVVSRFNLLEQSKQFSQEVRLGGNLPHGDWLIGAYYFGERLTGFTKFTPVTRAVTGGAQTLAQGIFFGGKLDTDAYAVFGQVRYELLPRLSLSGGLRYSDERKHVNEESNGLDLADNYDPTMAPKIVSRQDSAVKFHSTTPRVSLEYQADREVLLYVTYAKGFKSGGYNLGGITPPFFPEKLTDYEGGIKADWLHGALRTNLSGFYYDYKNLQVQKVVGTIQQVLNAASATVKGIEAEIVARPIAHLQLDGSLALLDGKYKDFLTSDPARAELGTLDLSGNRLSQAPRYTVNAGVQYAIPSRVGTFTVRGEGYWVDRVYFSPFNRDVTSQPSYVKYNAFLNYEHTGTGWTAQLFIRNIANKRTIASAQVSSALWGFPVVGAYDAPRTFGGTIGYRF
jgi:iron complex outermembrane receptor protein